ncbi:glycine cleavage system protein T [Solemya velum gill symbiont]|uniref:glycine cleavage system aminomethyltransferase GcvT n=1 Tax=Solemya velum gill symbiont TaxID=2340 RepID=UPI000996E0C3|nr:glycine cleavage system aminomethyltransferase GcvT [Solemya velum gill symbiont]OOZ16015.1 glycine cleavage system protein T [Solemya velum gill symbiont]OOZ20219.1 glycine cleavage system protein T [Solemya velum gill symbiont]OOZ24029.1 glycine cleavage system protein T [Solemya velum gill symbiont]OOZ25709.1 glycine cleavage system protein T [Solemya velum gill symbiont]OOZ30784.1 glycine cleavage system protein T [Solemya velum gill symbiont]
MDQKTILNESHRAMGARMVPFGGWDMPVNYGSQIEEHHAVRQDAGMFDVSHMLVIDIKGSDSTHFLRHLIANDVARLKESGKALYSCMLNEQGGVIDDLIVYYLDDTWFRMVVNAGTADKDLGWIIGQSSGFDIEVAPRRDLAMIAVQGPNAVAKTLPLLNDEIRDSAGTLKPFHATWDSSWFIGRTGYTGEDGFEIMLPENDATDFWQQLADAGVRPCGLGSRDTLRLEAGMNLYGSDMDEETSPLEAGLKWTIALEPAERDFVGRQALEAKLAEGNLKTFVGLVLEGRGILRDHLPLFDGDKQIGEITSGGFSPTLERSIAYARVDADAPEQFEVEIRGKRLPVRKTKISFVRNGKACVDL